MTIRYRFSQALHDYLIRRDPSGLRDFKAIDEGGTISIRASNPTDMNITTAVEGGYLDPTGFYNAVIARRSEIRSGGQTRDPALYIQRYNRERAI